MPFSKAPYLVTGTNDPAKQVSTTYQNALLGALETSINAAGGGTSLFYNVMDYLDPARIPFVTDDLAGFEAALAAIKAATVVPAGGGVLYIPAGKYYLSDTLNIHTPVYIVGEGTGQGFAGSLIRFGKNCNGIVFNNGDTHGDGLGSQGTSTGSKLEGIQLYGGNVNANGSGVITSYNAGDSTTGHGVRIRTTFVALIDVFVTCFGGDGININCDGNGGNANNFYVERCQSIYNRGHAYLVNGSDANAGVFMCNSAIECGGGGFIDYSFLGNTHIQGHVRGCGIDDPTVAGFGTGGPTGACEYLGVTYFVVAGQETAASTTTPGTDPTVWKPYGGVVGGFSKTWVSGMTWINGSAYGTSPINVNARGLFLCCYSEQSFPPVQMTYPNLIVSGLFPDGVYGSAGLLQGTDGAVTAQGFQAIILDADINPDNKFSIVGNHNGFCGPDTMVYHNDGTNAHRFYGFAGSIQYQRNGQPIVNFTANGVDLANDARSYSIAGVKVVGAQGAAVADATDAASAITQLNAVIARLEAHGLIAS